MQALTKNKNKSNVGSKMPYPGKFGTKNGLFVCYLGNFEKLLSHLITALSS